MSSAVCRLQTPYTAAIVADWLNWTMQKQRENCDLHDLRSAFEWYPLNSLLPGLISSLIECSLDSSFLALVGKRAGWPIADARFRKLAHIQEESFVPYKCLLVHSGHTLLSELFCSRGAEEFCEMFAETPHCGGHKWWGYKRNSHIGAIWLTQRILLAVSGTFDIQWSSTF